MRYVCPKDVKKMLVQQARSVHWKKWAAKHEYEELNEGIWLEPALALLRKKTKEEWTEKHRNVARRIFLEGGWVQKRLFDIGLSDEGKCQACCKEEGKEKHRLCHCPEWYEVRRGIPDASRKWEQKARTSKKERNWQRGIVVHPLGESQWNRGHFSMKKWESEQHQSWSIPVGGFAGHVAADVSLVGMAGKWRACGCSVVQLDFDKELGLLYAMYGSMEAAFEVQRTIERAELKVFLCLLKNVIGPIKVHVDNKGIMDGLWKGERKRYRPESWRC